MLILYGTQGGTSKSVALLLQSILENGYSDEYISEIDLSNDCNSIMEMDKFDFKKILDVNCIIFICSTQGSGTEPFNMTRFWNMLKKIKLPNFLSHLYFAVFGLGDSSYDLYNYCSKKLYNLLIRLGAKPLVRRGCGDDQDKEGWLTDFKPWCLDLLNNDIIKKQALADATLYESKIKNVYHVEVNKMEYLTSVDYNPLIMEMELTIDDFDTFKPGDCLGIDPYNYNIEEFKKYNGLNDPRIEVCDFNSVPQNIFFSYLYQFLIKNKIKIEEEKKRKVLELFRDYSFYFEYIKEPKRTIFETIKELDIILSVEFILRYIPKISTRYFTLAKRNDKFFILLSLVEYKTILKVNRKGLCSEYLKSDLDILRCKMGRSLINIMKDKVLIICTGAGVSIANAMVNFYSDKEFIVFYGFRFWAMDCVDKDIKGKINVKIYYASSRDDKQYVQDVYKKNPIQNIEDYDIVIGGNSRLNKIVDELFKEIYTEKIYFHSETW